MITNTKVLTFLFGFPFLFCSEDKMHLYAVHDTTLIPLLIAVGIFEDAWPGFCSDVIIETYQDQNGDCFIRILYLGKVMFLTKKIKTECFSFSNKEDT